jgi:hypothetical protein
MRKDKSWLQSNISRFVAELKCPMQRLHISGDCCMGIKGITDDVITSKPSWQDD